MNIFRKSKPKHRFSLEEEKRIQDFMSEDELKEFTALLMGYAFSGAKNSLLAADAIRNDAISRMHLVDTICGEC